jgi:aryl-alcohol dehydrogenase-like predicted oxidoreductase
LNIKCLKQKVGLGTVQLGGAYGINNQGGKPSEEEAHKILGRAEREEIHLLDSAEAYGDSLAVIGRYLKKNRKFPFKIISKFIGDGELVDSKLSRSLSFLGQNSLYALMFHRFSDYQTDQYMEQLLKLKSSGKIAKIGVSIYSERELETCIEDPDISIIQVPFHPFDSSKEKRNLLIKAKLRNKEVHVRSIFLQGLFFKKPEGLTGNLQGMKEPLQTFHMLLEQHRVGVLEACLNYPLHQEFIDHVIVGVEREEQLEENLNAIMVDSPVELFSQLEAVPIPDLELLNPTNWRP